jgi:hypothetical protein
MPGRFRAKADEYVDLAKSADTPESARQFKKLERSFRTLADNEQWMNEHFNETLHAPLLAGDKKPELTADDDESELTAEEENILRYLGAALLMRWNTLPQKLQRELFDAAGSMGESLAVDGLRAQIARYLHKHKDDKVNA